jgi:hypothetical protein
MSLDYLDFDYTEDEQGNGSFDAIAAVSPAQWPALQAEVQRVLAWAHAEFPGAQGAPEDGGQWDFELQGLREVPTPLSIQYDERRGELRVADGAPGQPRLTLGLTLTGSPGFCEALRQAFSLD